MESQSPFMRRAGEPGEKLKLRIPAQMLEVEVDWESSEVLAVLAKDPLLGYLGTEESPRRLTRFRDTTKWMHQEEYLLEFRTTSSVEPEGAA
jgi:hypothetical protein